MARDGFVKELYNDVTDDAYEQLIKDFETYGTRVVVNGSGTSELQSYVYWTPTGEYPHRSKMSKKLVIAEALQMVAGEFDHDMLKIAAPNANHDLFTKIMAYGPRIKNGLANAHVTLKNDPASRRAVALILKPSDRGTDQIPCTVSMQFLIRAGLMHTSVYMRSWDAVYGLPYDLGVFGAVSALFARSLSVVPSTMAVHAGSLHVYDSTRHLANADGVGRIKVKKHVPHGSWRKIVAMSAIALNNIRTDGIWDWMLDVEVEKYDDHES